MDQSNGYESIVPEFTSHRSTEMGMREVRKWAKTLQKGSSLIDLGCGSGRPLTSIMVREGLDVFGLDASPSLVAAFRKNLPGTPVVCEAIQTSSCFKRSFDAVLPWGLMFLLKDEEQRRLIERVTGIMTTNGRLLITSPARAGRWKDAMTNKVSLSLERRSTASF